MTSRSFSPHVVLSTFVVIFAAGTSAVAQDGKLRLHVNPKQAYLWVDDRAVSEASKHPSLELSAGEHKIELANYGYKAITQTVTITAGETSDLEVTLDKVGKTVSGPFGAIAIKGADRDAVFLNGNTPDNAACGAKSYLVNGKMVSGFAFVAYAAVYRSTGVMTFIVNQNGIVSQKDLGPDTEKIANAMTGYDPNSTWHWVD
jgi:hypothetical protein